jgi:hypothetical protein
MYWPYCPSTMAQPPLFRTKDYRYAEILSSDKLHIPTMPAALALTAVQAELKPLVTNMLKSFYE